MRQRKVHHASVGRPDIGLCGIVTAGSIDPVQIVSDLQFSWLPKQSQCITCRSARKTKGWMCATPEMLVTVECFLLEFSRLCHAAAEHPHVERGCYHRTFVVADYASLEPCWCGRHSLLDPAQGERALAAALGGSDDGYVFRHVCRSCGMAFRTKHPRGPQPTCNFCRGTIGDAFNHTEAYTSAFAARLQRGERV